MLSSRPVVRLATANSARVVPRRAAQSRVCRRFQSTNSTAQPSSNVGKLFLAGVAGGLTVLGAGYAYYHFSGAKRVVDASKSVKEYFKQKKDAIVQQAPKSPNEVLFFLRSVVKSYAGFIPGANAYVDSSFDTLDELHETHRPEFDKILQGAFDDVTAILKDSKDNGFNNLDADTVGKLFGVLVTRMSQLQALAKRAGSDAFVRFEERYPQAGQVLGSSYAELRSLARRSGPEAQHLLDESMQQVQDILSGKYNPEALNRAKDVLNDKLRQLKGMLWDRAMEETKNTPELRSLLQENKEAFMQAEVSSSTLKEVLEWVKETVAEGGSISKEKLSQMREYLQGKISGTYGINLEGVSEWLKKIPGGEEARKFLPGDIKVFIQVSRQKGSDAKELAKETFRDVHNVLHEKAEKARQITREESSETDEKSS